MKNKNNSKGMSKTVFVTAIICVLIVGLVSGIAAGYFLNQNKKEEKSSEQVSSYSKDFDALKYIEIGDYKNITVNVIKNGKSVEKKTLSLPKRLTNVIKCSNPRCICNNEDIDHIFTLTDDSGTYRCLYCETKAK